MFLCFHVKFKHESTKTCNIFMYLIHLVPPFIPHYMVKLRVYYTSLCVLAGPELAQLLDRDTHQLWSCLSDTSHSSEQVTRALTVWLWVSDRHAVMDSLGGGAQALIQLVVAGCI